MKNERRARLTDLALTIGYMYGQPGKKLLFMGGEFGQWDEWYHETSLDWQLLQFDSQAGVQRWIEDLNRLYRREPALHEQDFTPAGFELIECNDIDSSVVSFVRKAKNPEDMLLMAANFTPVVRLNYRVGVPKGGFCKEVLNSDSTLNWGSGQGNLGGMEAAAIPCYGRPYSLNLTLPPLGIVFFKPEG